MISESIRFLAQPREMSPIWVGMILGERRGLRHTRRGLERQGLQDLVLGGLAGSGGHAVHDSMHLGHHDEVKNGICHKCE